MVIILTIKTEKLYREARSSEANRRLTLANPFMQKLYTNEIKGHPCKN